MNTIDYLHPLIEKIFSEHQQIQHDLDRVLCLVREPFTSVELDCRFGQVSNALLSLRTRLQDHIAQEKDGGVLEEAVVRLPRIAHEATTLARENVELLRSLNKAIVFIDSSGKSRNDWRILNNAVEDIVARIKQHEAAENRLLQVGFNNDLGLANDGT